MINKIVFILLCLFFIACSHLPSYDVDDWAKLIDPDFHQEEIVDFYTNQVKKVKEGSVEESKIYTQLQKELKNAGNNKNMDKKSVMLKGYIVPIDTQKDKVNKFLFFPNQAACIHVPASPANQTIYVESKENQGVKLEDAYSRVTVYGTLHLQEIKVANGTASFFIKNAITRVFP